MNEVDPKIHPPTPIPDSDSDSDGTEIEEMSVGNGDAPETVPDSCKPSFARLLLLAKPEMVPFILSCVVMMGSEACVMIIPLVIANAIDVFTDTTDIEVGAKLAEVGQYMVTSIWLGWIAIVTGFFRAAIQWIIGQRVVARLRCQVYKAILKQEIAFFDTTKTGELVSRLGSDTTLLQTVLDLHLPGFIAHLAKFVTTIILMFYISAKLAGVAFAGVILIFFITYPMAKVMGRLGKEYQDLLGKAQGHSTEAMGSMRTVQAFTAEEKEWTRYNNDIGNPDDFPWWRYPKGPKGRTTYQVGFIKSFFVSAFIVLIIGLGVTLIIGTVWYGFYLVSRDELTLGGLTAFLVFIMSIGTNVAKITESVAIGYEALAAGGRLFYLLDRTPQIPKPPSSPDMELEPIIKPDRMEGRVELKNVTFSYPSRPGQSVLDGVSLKIEPNTTTALVGGSGSGKSTIVSLMQRFYDTNEGQITVDGHDIESLDLQWLRQNIGFVQQEPNLFGISVRDNILYGIEREVSQNEIISVTKDANAHDFISKMPEGYDTLVGERGVQLSGGQKQRIAIARALLKKPAILLLDEATSALDAESEHLVQQAIDKACKGRTVIVVAHRLSTIRDADQIVVMNNHKVVGRGSHDNLLTKCSKYKDLIKRQSVMVRDVDMKQMLPDMDTSFAKSVVEDDATSANDASECHSKDVSPSKDGASKDDASKDGASKDGSKEDPLQDFVFAVSSAINAFTQGLQARK
ncbi:hypothetical protein ACHAWF_012649 [Thalassiosira exigua]